MGPRHLDADSRLPFRHNGIAEPHDVVIMLSGLLNRGEHPQAF